MKDIVGQSFRVILFAVSCSETGPPHLSIHAPPSRLVSKLALETPFGAFLADAGIGLLEGIERHGSLSRAAKDVPLSYKAASDALDRMNKLADQPLVVRSTGGLHGGGTLLTDYGRKMIALYRAMEKEHQEALDRLSEKLHGMQGGDIAQFRTLMKRLSVKTSALNQFAGNISGLRLSCYAKIRSTPK